MTGQPRCQECGGELTGPRGHCPRCLFQAGLEGDAMSLGAGGDVGVTMTLGAPGPSGGASTLDALSASIGPVPRVLLRDTDPGIEPTVRPGTGTPAGPVDHAGRLQLLGEIAHGGMGAVLRGRDPDLGRELAVKVLLDRHRDDPNLIRRFIEEAQIAGQLQHPGIVPVYELGTFADRRPYFSMKLVRGRTLAELLRERPTPASDLPRFLGIFEAICQTMAYAHARGVIHRDLKPSNVMVGSFGEVQVMDWGLAKVLPRAGVEAQADAVEQEAIIATAWCGSDSDLSLAGSVMGTPSYMAPEQARGEVDRLDERADVFALGSILCEILTGRPAFDGGDVLAIQCQAAAGETAAARARLDTCGADAEWPALAKDCLATAAADRPRDAGVVAGRVRAYLLGVQERLRLAELARVEERARRRLTTVVAGSVVALVGVLAAGGAWVNHQSAARTAAAARALRDSLVEVRALHARAMAGPADDPTDWIKALEAGRRAESFLDEGETDPAERARWRSFLETVRKEGRAAETHADELHADRRILDRLSDSRLAYGEHYDRARLDALYARAFREYGIDIKSLDPAEAGRRIAARPIAQELVGALDEWIFNQQAMGDRPGVWLLIRVAATADPDLRRTGIRAALAMGSLAALERLADSIDLDSMPVISAQRLAMGLAQLGDPARGVDLLRRLRLRHPGDYWINVDLANLLLGRDPPALEEVSRFASVAVAIRPRNPTGYDTLASALIRSGRVDEALAEYRELIRHYPEGSMARCNFGAILFLHGDAEEAAKQLREALRLDPNNPHAHRNLAGIWRSRGQLDEAIAEYHKALRIKGDHAGTVLNELGDLLSWTDRIDEAIAVFRELSRIQPDNAPARAALGGLLLEKGEVGVACAEVRELLRLEPGDADVRYQAALLQLATSPDAKVYREFASADLERLGGTADPEVAYQVARTGSLAPGVTDHPETLAALAEKSVALDPEHGWRHYVLGLALYRAGRYEEAVRQLDESRQVDPTWGATALAWPVLAMAQHRLGHAAEAMRSLVQAERSNASRIGAWWDRLELKLTLREAQALVRDSQFPDDPFARGN